MEIKQNESLLKHTTFNLGGSARYFCEVYSIEELKKILGFIKEKKLPYFILGGGSNLVVDDEGFDGVVIKIRNQELEIQKNVIEVGAGASLAKVVNESLRNCLIGLEWAFGIPGTIGGAVRGNAGAYRGEMKDSIYLVKVIRNGKLVELKNKDCDFGYRESIFKNNSDIIWSVILKLEKGSKKDLENAKKKIDKIKKERKEKFGNQKSAGSFFQNILMSEKKIKEFKKKFLELPDQFVEFRKVPAAWLIDQCGLMGFCVGNICVSEKHAGILINLGDGKSSELLQLVSLIKTRVRDKFGVTLHEEVQYLK